MMMMSALSLTNALTISELALNNNHALTHSLINSIRSVAYHCGWLNRVSGIMARMLDLGCGRSLVRVPVVSIKDYEISYIIARTSLLQWDDDEVRFVLDQHAELDCYSASSLKQQSAVRHVAPLGHIVFDRTFSLKIFHPQFLYAQFLPHFK
jgi:hypothetical protein